MKKIMLLLLCTVLVPAITNAQIKVDKTYDYQYIGEARTLNGRIAQLKKAVDNSVQPPTGYYVLNFRNMEYQYLISFESVIFEGDKNLDDLYNILMSVFDPQNIGNKDYRVSFDLGGYRCSVANFSMLGMNLVYFSNGKGYVYLKKRQVKKLFNRN